MAFFTGAGIVLKQRDKYVLIQEARHEKAGFFNLPAGTLEVHEGFIECVQREAKEETGAGVELQHFLGVYQTVIASGSNVVFLIFAGKVADDASFTSEEHAVIKAFTYEEVLELDREGKLRAPTVLKAIQDHRAGKLYPLEAVQAWHIDALSSITVEKDH
ncbi:MAG TPA: NUDIX domain-containing protein [Candidatus Saccharimonadales bacterium]|nr:NUDIX domain-containing protein [Candidatus Saccharimonadales bacterium]